MRVRRNSLPRDGTVIQSCVSSLEAGTGLNELAVRISQAARLAVGARSDRRFPRSQLTGAIRLERAMRSTCATKPYQHDITGEDPAARRRKK